MKRFLPTVAVLAAVQAVLALAYVSFGEREQAEVQVDRVRWPAPELGLRDVRGNARTLAAYRGRPVLLHFWATWCPPCREELPGLLQWASSGEIAVLAVTVDPDWEDVRRFLDRDPPPSVLQARWEEAADAFALSSLPETYLVDASGHVRLRFPGPRDWTSPAVREVVLQAAPGTVE